MIYFDRQICHARGCCRVVYIQRCDARQRCFLLWRWMAQECLCARDMRYFRRCAQSAKERCRRRGGRYEWCAAWHARVPTVTMSLFNLRVSAQAVRPAPFCCLPAHAVTRAPAPQRPAAVTATDYCAIWRERHEYAMFVRVTFAATPRSAFHARRLLPSHDIFHAAADAVTAAYASLRFDAPPPSCRCRRLPLIFRHAAASARYDADGAMSDVLMLFYARHTRALPPR